MPDRWPNRPRLIRQLRDVLRREFGCQDAWVVTSGGRCRLEVRLRGRQLVLLEDDEQVFWARFYVSRESERLHLGERTVRVEQWRKADADVVAELTVHWTQRVGAPGPG